MILALLLAAAAPASQPAPSTSPDVKAALAGCKHTLGPIAVDMQTVAYACERKETSEAWVMARLPSGELARKCDKIVQPGELVTLEVRRPAAHTVLWFASAVRSPDDERNTESAIVPRWGRCEVVAQSSLRHRLDRPTLDEPAGGIDFDDHGFTAWSEIKYLRFEEPERVVATAVLGARYEVKNERWEKQPTSASTHVPVPVTWAAQTLPAGGKVIVALPPGAPIRGARIRLGKGAATLLLGRSEGPLCAWAPNDKQWTHEGVVFGRGFTGAEDGRQAVVFFEPPLPAGSLTLQSDGGPVRVEALTVFADDPALRFFSDTAE